MTQEATINYRNPLGALEGDADAIYYGLSATAWLKIAVVSLLMAATFRFNLVRLWLKTNPFTGQPNWRHAICVPLIGIYYLYVHRDELLASKIYTAWSGLGILVLGILLFAYGIYPGQNDFVKDFGMVIALFGVVTLLCGWDVMKLASFPILFLVCAIPWPELVYSYVASPLQRLAASVAVVVLKTGGVEAFHSGTKIIINGKNNLWRTLNVAEACAGLRSLMTFISVAAAIAFLSARPLWQKVIVTVMAIPIAVGCNVMRVSGQGFLDRWNRELSEGFAHQFAGIVMLIPGFFLILFVGWLLDQVFIEVVDDREERRKRAAIVKPAKPVEWTVPGANRLEPQPALAGGAVARLTIEKPVTTTAVSRPAPAPAPLVAKIPVATPAVASPAVVAPKVAATPAPAPPVAKPVARPAAATPAAPVGPTVVKPVAKATPATAAPAAPGLKPAAPKPAARPAVVPVSPGLKAPPAAPLKPSVAVSGAPAPVAKPAVPVAPAAGVVAKAQPVKTTAPAPSVNSAVVARPVAPKPVAPSEGT